MPAANIIKEDPLVVNHFFLEIDGEVISELSEGNGRDGELEVVDVQQELPSGQ